MRQHGNLSKYGLLDLLRSVRDERFCGTIDIEARDDQVRLWVSNGHVVHARSSALRHSFPAYLLSQQLVQRNELKELLDIARVHRIRLESLLLERELLDEATLAAAQGSLARYVLSFAFGLAPASTVLSRTTVPSALPHGLELDLERAFFRFIATRDTPEEEASLLRDCFDKPLVPTPQFERWLTFLVEEFSPNPEIQTLDHILEAIVSRNCTVSSLLEEGNDAFDVVRRVFALHRTGMIRIGSDEDSHRTWDDVLGAYSPTPSASSPSPEIGPADVSDSAAIPVPAPALESARPPHRAQSNVTQLPRAAMSPSAPPTPEAHPMERQMLQTWEQLEDSSLYEALGVSEDAPIGTIRQRFRTLRLRYDPQAFAQAQLSPTGADAIRRIAERLELAYRTLTDYERRSAYHVAQQIPPRTLRVSLKALFEAETLTQRAAELIREGQLAEAVALLRNAVTLAPIDPACRAELAWAVFLTARRGPAGSDVRSTVTSLLSEAQDIDPRSEAVLRIRSRVARMEGRMREALEGYQRLLALNPHSREASRALAEIRAILGRSDFPKNDSVEEAALAEAEPAQSETPPPPSDPQGVVHRITGLFRRR